MAAPSTPPSLSKTDPSTAAQLASYVRSLGHAVRIATTLADVNQAIADGGFCYVLLDKQIPAVLGVEAIVATGDLAQKRLRTMNSRRHPKSDMHILPNPRRLGLLQNPGLRRAERSNGACDFIPKPCDAETVTRAILATLERVEREDHAQCVALGGATAADAKAGPTQPLVHLVLDGIPIDKRISSRDGKRCDLQPERFIVLLRLSAPRARASESYLSTSDLGLPSRPEIPSRIHEAVAHAVPEGFLIIQKGGEARRLHPLVSVAPINWATLSAPNTRGFPGSPPPSENYAKKNENAALSTGWRRADQKKIKRVLRPHGTAVFPG